MGESSHNTSTSSRRRDSRSRSPDRSSRRHRDRSPRRSSHRDRDHDDHDRSHRKDKDKDSHRHRRDRSPSNDDGSGPPPGVGDLSDDDYFLKATELKLWLYEDRGKKLDSLKTEDARRYFRKFVRAWNAGRLDAKYYAGIAPGSLPSSISTSHSWSFKKASQADLDAAATVRRSVDGTKTRSYDPTAAPGPAPPPSTSSSSRAVAGPSRGPQLGPAMPPSSAVERLQMERDARDSTRSADREAYSAQRRREAREGRHAERDERATGRDRLVEKRREGNASRRDFEASREGGGMMDFDEDALMSGSTGAGGGPAGPGSFEDAVKARERAQSRREERKFGGEEKRAEMTDRLSAHRQKEDATMAMFKQLAAQRFGGGAS
ncbi:hypothetical protein JCM9279_001963 [Rhodotorula babjevae]